MAKFNLEAALKKARKNMAKGFERRDAGEASGFETFDDGRYNFRLLGIDLGESKAGRFQAIFRWKFLGGEYAGKEYLSFQGLDTDDGWLYFLADLARLNFEVESPEDLTTKALKEINASIKSDKPIVAAQLRTKGDFQNLRLGNNCLLDPDDVEEGDDEAEDDEEDAPKKKVAGKKKPAPADDEDEDDDADAGDDEDDDEEEETPKKKPAGKKKPAPKDEDDEDEEDEDEDDDEPIAVAAGSRVRMKTKAGEQDGEVVEADEDTNKVTVKFDTGKTLTLSAEKIIEVLPEKKAKSKKR